MADFRVVLVEPSYEESIGFVARTMKNFGLSDLHLVNPRTLLGPEGRMRGGHAQDVLDSIIEHRSLSEALEGLDLSIGTTAQISYASSNLVRKPLTPKDLSQILSNVSGRIGIVFGREGTGLTNMELDLCDATVTIPAASEYRTLNLSHAAAIILYELYKSAGENSADDLASDDVKKTILGFLSESASLSGMKEHDCTLLTRAFRNILGRSALRHREGSLLVEAMRKISENLSRSEDREILEEVSTNSVPDKETHMAQKTQGLC